ncbi:hypothetical protein SFRURICE_002110 [Spodoptera frugiperda]|nr:hypothetical protein SFRURICE_002110 [Spodoptera frugiperda]
MNKVEISIDNDKYCKAATSPHLHTLLMMKSACFAIIADRDRRVKVKFIKERFLKGLGGGGRERNRPGERESQT